MSYKQPVCVSNLIFKSLFFLLYLMRFAFLVNSLKIIECVHSFMCSCRDVILINKNNHYHEKLCVKITLEYLTRHQQAAFRHHSSCVNRAVFKADLTSLDENIMALLERMGRQCRPCTPSFGQTDKDCRTFTEWWVMGSAQKSVPINECWNGGTLNTQ